MELPGTALRIDNYLKGDWLSISSALKKEGLEESLDGAKALWERLWHWMLGDFCCSFFWMLSHRIKFPCFFLFFGRGWQSVSRWWFLLVAYFGWVDSGCCHLFFLKLVSFLCRFFGPPLFLIICRNTWPNGLASTNPSHVVSLVLWSWSPLVWLVPWSCSHFVCFRGIWWLPHRMIGDIQIHQQLQAWSRWSRQSHKRYVMWQKM